jgi:hypothetical protein
MIQSDLNKSFKVIMENRNIIKDFQNEEQRKGNKKPAEDFSMLMKCIEQVKANVEHILKDQITASLGELQLNVTNVIQGITRSIRNELMSHFKDLMSQTGGSLSTPSFDIDGI